MGFFLTGVPGETDEDIEASISFAKKACDFAIIDTLKVYPGTPLFDKVGHLVTFSLAPYHNEFTDEEHNKKAAERRSTFYRKYYFSLRFFARSPRLTINNLSHLKDVLPYVIKQSFKPQMQGS